MGRVAKYTLEQIVAKLREHERLQAQGLTIPRVCKRIGYQRSNVLSLADEVRAVKEDEAHRLKALETENTRLKRIVAEQALDISMLKDLHRENGEPVASPGRREVPAQNGIRCRSGGRAAWSGSTARRNATLASRAIFELRLVKRMNELAALCPRWEWPDPLGSVRPL